MNHLSFADDTALVADSEAKLCRLVSEFGRVCEIRKLRVNVGKSKVMRCSRYCNGGRMHVLGDLNEIPILLEEVRQAVNEMKSGKAPGLDGFPGECLKKGGMAVLEWLVRLLNVNFVMRVVPMERRGACIVPLDKRKGKKCE